MTKLFKLPKDKQVIYPKHKGIKVSKTVAWVLLDGIVTASKKGNGLKV